MFIRSKEAPQYIACVCFVFFFCSFRSQKLGLKKGPQCINSRNKYFQTNDKTQEKNDTHNPYDAWTKHTGMVHFSSLRKKDNIIWCVFFLWLVHFRKHFFGDERPFIRNRKKYLILNRIKYQSIIFYVISQRNASSARQILDYMARFSTILHI